MGEEGEVSIERIDDGLGYVVECDKCSSFIGIDSEDFTDAVDTAKQQGWKIRKDKDGDWIHLCPMHEG